jgi:hypothetical protein
MRILYIPALLLFLHGCSFQKADISDIKISDISSDSVGSFCSDFSLTNSQVLELIEKSREVEINEFHNNYEYLPCYVKGTLNKGNSKCKFTIRAGGTVEISCNDKSGYLYVCDSCDSLLGERE